MSTDTLIYINTSSTLLQIKRNICNFLFVVESRSEELVSAMVKEKLSNLNRFVFLND